MTSGLDLATIMIFDLSENHMAYYRGWEIWESATAPVTGRWQAIRFGVKMGTTTKEGIKLMIDQRNEEHKIEERKFLGT